MTLEFLKGIPDGTVPQFNPFWKELRSDPYPVYNFYRQHDPVHWGHANAPPHTGYWHLFRFSDIHSVLSDARFGREPLRVRMGFPYPQPPDPYRPFLNLIRKWFLFREPPYHTKLKDPVRELLKPNEVLTLANRIEERSNALIDNLIVKMGVSGHVDFISEFAIPFPVMVISDLLGLNSISIETMRTWARDLEAGIDARLSNEAAVLASKTVREMNQLFEQEISGRSAGVKNGLISALLEHKNNAPTYTDEEIIATCILLLFAGHETTSNLIGNGMLALLTHQEALHKLKSEPELISAAVVELLRFDSPVQFTSRTAYADVMIDGKTIHRGQEVALHLGSANRDPEVFSEPDKLNFLRKENRHMGFGKGIHYCVGPHLALLEAEIAYKGLLQRLPEISLAQQKPLRAKTISFRGVQSLSIAF